MQHADDVVDVTLVDWQAGVLAGTDLFENAFQAVVQVDADDFVARHHDVIDRDIFQVEDRQQHGLVAMRNQGAGFVYHRAQLVTGQAPPAAFNAFDADQAEQAIGNGVDQPYQGIKHFKQWLQQQRGGVGDTLRLDGGVGFGAYLTEDQQHDGQH